jgi:hypothetical protein
MPEQSVRIPTIAAGVALGVAFTLSPLAVLVVVGFGLLLTQVSRSLPPDERWWFVRLFVIAFAVRLAAIAALFLVSAHDSQGAGILFGDESYALARSWRLRNVLLDIPQLKYDYIKAFEDYGHSSYIDVMAYLQVLVGPSPYGLRMLNAALFLGGVLLLFRMTRRAFGAFAAFAGSTVLLFLPTLFFWSISLLKESFYFVLTVAVLAALIELMATSSWRRRTLCAIVFAASLVALRDLRGGAVALAVTGVGVGLVAGYILARRSRIAIAAAVIAAACLATAVVPSLRQRAIVAVEEAAKANAGHVFTVGHGYKLLDEGFYVEPTAKREYQLDVAEAGRYVVRAVTSYLLMPLPWQMETTGELAYLPEQLFWYVLLLLLPIGAIAALKRDRTFAVLLVAYILPTAAVVAVTTGNVGTLIRHRTLIVPFVVWVSALGFASLMHWMLRRQELAA